MGINELFTIRLCLDSNPFLGNPGFKKTILLKGFKLLSWYFHISFADHEEATEKLKKITALISKLHNAFQSPSIPGKNISINEELVKFNKFISVVNDLEMQKMQTVRGYNFWHSDLCLVLAKQLVSNYSSYKKHLVLWLVIMILI